MRASEMGIFKQKGVETQIYLKKGTTDGKFHTICDIKNRDVVIDWLEFATSQASNQLEIYPYLEDGKLGNQLYLVEKDGSVSLALTPQYIHNAESILFYELVYETGFYKFGLGHSLPFGNGVKIRIQGTSGTKLGIYTQITIRG